MPRSFAKVTKALGITAAWVVWIGQAWAGQAQVEVLRIEEAGDCQILRPTMRLQTPSASRVGLGEASALSFSEGNLVYELRFAKIDAEPEVKLIYSSLARSMTKAMLSQAKGHRLKCSVPVEKPVVDTVSVTVRLGSDPGGQLDTMDFVPFLRSMDKAGLKGARFDFNAMACPFDLKVTLLQPYAPNVVAEMAQPDVAREPFRAWLTTLKFQFPGGTERYGIGQRVKVSVPCMALDLS